MVVDLDHVDGRIGSPADRSAQTDSAGFKLIAIVPVSHDVPTVAASIGGLRLRTL